MLYLLPTQLAGRSQPLVLRHATVKKEMGAVNELNKIKYSDLKEILQKLPMSLVGK
jgi:hypothetical protein